MSEFRCRVSSGDQIDIETCLTFLFDAGVRRSATCRTQSQLECVARLKSIGDLVVSERSDTYAYLH